MEADLEDDASPGGDAVLPPHPRVRRAIGIDIGGTKIAAGVITAEGRIEERALVPTPMGDEPAAVSAEARYGAGAGSDHMVLLTVGTGIGGGLVLDGRVYRGSSGLGAEVGHMTVDPDGDPCDCGNLGCLEAMASGSALGRAGRRAAEADPGGLLAQLAGDPEKVTGELVFRAAQRGDATAIELFERLGFWLGVGTGSLVTVFDPELVVIGGGLVHTGDLLLKPARASMVGAATLALRAGG